MSALQCSSVHYYGCEYMDLEVSSNNTTYTLCSTPLSVVVDIQVRGKVVVIGATNRIE
ncbi:MAG: hypothetical protein WA941_15675 [Nitrososphaeraceae archaeon]